MSREIKFRTWDTEFKEFSEWTNRDPFFSTSTSDIFYWERVRKPDGSYDGDIVLLDKNERFVLQQFSGLQDKHGKDVYEGDIIRHTFKQDEHGDLETWVSEVVFEDQAFGTKEDVFFNWTSAPSWSCEVIGNIFETPELANS